MVLQSFGFTYVLDIEVLIIFAQLDETLLEDRHFVPQVDLFVVKLLDEDTAVNGDLQSLELLLEVLVVGVGDQVVLLPLGLDLQLLNLEIDLADKAQDGFVGGWVQFLRDVLGINLFHHLSDHVLRFLVLFLLVVVNLDMLLLSLFHLLLQVVEFLIELLYLIGG